MRHIKRGRNKIYAGIRPHSHRCCCCCWMLCTTTTTHHLTWNMCSAVQPRPTLPKPKSRSQFHWLAGCPAAVPAGPVRAEHSGRASATERHGGENSEGEEDGGRRRERVRPVAGYRAREYNSGCIAHTAPTRSNGLLK